MIPVNMMPLLANYWPFVLVGVFVWTILYISIDKTRETFRKEEEKFERLAEKRRRVEAGEDDDDSVEALDAAPTTTDGPDIGEDVEFIPYKNEKYSEVGENLSYW